MEADMINCELGFQLTKTIIFLILQIASKQKKTFNVAFEM